MIDFNQIAVERGRDRFGTDYSAWLLHSPGKQKHQYGIAFKKSLALISVFKGS